MREAGLRFRFGRGAPPRGAPTSQVLSRALAGVYHPPVRLETDLPEPGEREWLLEELSGLCAAAGGTPLLTEPVLPTSHWFPDHWDGKERGLANLTRRVLQHAGLGHLGLALDVAAQPLTVRDGVVAWFAGLRDGHLCLGVRSWALQDPVVLAAALAHEAAHAWREVHAIPPGEDQDTEEFLTDVTAVYLGFGALTANAAALHRAGTHAAGAMWRYAVWHDHYGYLPMASMAFLLAAQLVAQGADRRARRRLLARLHANQAQAFGKAWRLLLRDPQGLRRRLGLPPHPCRLQRAPPAPLPAGEVVVRDRPVTDRRRRSEE